VSEQFQTFLFAGVSAANEKILILCELCVFAVKETDEQ
jgi:hypothetical protein